MRATNRILPVAVLTCVALAACDTGDDVTFPDGEAEFDLVMQPEGGAAASSVALVDTWGARIDLQGVTAITLPIGRVEAQSEDGGWVEAGDVDMEVDLFALPEDGVVLLDSSLPQGSYTGLRLYLTGEPTITLADEVVVGRAVFEAGTHPLVIPSADQNGVRLNAAFDVDEGGQLLTVLFDGGATVQKVTATGSGTLKISPVLHVQNDDGEDVGEFEPGDEDEGQTAFSGLVAATGANGFTLDDDTEIRIDESTGFDGDILTLAALAQAVANGETVQAEGHGTLDGGVIVADEVEFETDDEGEFEGGIVDMSAGELADTLTVETASSTQITVVVTPDTDIDADGDLLTLDAVYAAFDLGTAIQVEGSGSVDAEGRIVADMVKFETDED